MEGLTFEILNDVQQPEDIFSHFETSNMLSLKCASKVDFNDINVYRGFEYMGISLKEQVVSFDTNGENEGFLKLDNDIEMITNSPDGRFVLVITKNNFMYLILSPINRVFYKKEIDVSESDFTKKALILKLNDSSSEIWIFLKQYVFIYRNVNYCELEQAILSDNAQSKKQLLNDIYLERKYFPFLCPDRHLVQINVKTCRKSDEFLMALLFSDILVVVSGHVDNTKSFVDYIYETDLLRYGVVVTNVNKRSMEISADEANVFFIDDNGMLWICNFIMGVMVLPPSKNNMDSLVDVVLSSSLVITSRQCNENHTNSLDILSLPLLNAVGNFAISSRSIIYPVPRAQDPILFVDNIDTDPQLLIIKSIRLLDTDVRLKEILATNNFEYAFKFAELFHMNREPIYIHQLVYIIQSTSNNQSLSAEQYTALYTCMKEIESFFDIGIYKRLLTKDEHSFVLRQLHAQTTQAIEQRTHFLDQIEHELIEINRPFPQVLNDQNRERINVIRAIFDRQCGEIEEIGTSLIEMLLIPAAWPEKEEFLNQVEIAASAVDARLGGLKSTIVIMKNHDDFDKEENIDQIANVNNFN